MIDFIGLEIIEFHDVPLKSMNIQNELSPKLVLEIFLYDEEIADYINTKLIFGKLHHINPKNLSVEESADFEIYSFDYHLEGELFFGKIIFVTGSGKPSFEVDFSCKTVEVQETKIEHGKT